MDKLPRDKAISHYTGGDTNIAIGRMLKFILNPFVKDNYYYQVDIPARKFMDYAAMIDGSPNTILTAILYKVCADYFRESTKNHISGRIAADYRSDVGADFSYRDFVRLIHVKYEWGWKEESIQKLNMRARGQVIVQSQPELSRERFFKLEKVHDEIDRKPVDLFCRILDQEKIPYKVSGQLKRYLPRIEMP